MISHIQTLDKKPISHHAAFLSKLSAHWVSILYNRQFPLSSAFRPENFAKELGLLAMINVNEDGSFSNRIIGDIVGERLALKNAGHSIEQIEHDDTRKSVMRLINQTVTEGMPVLAEGSVTGRNAMEQSFCALSLPFSRDEDNDKLAIVMIGFRFRLLQHASLVNVQSHDQMAQNGPHLS